MVMLRAVFSWSQGFNVNTLLGSPFITNHSTHRFLSLNSAIRRGLRKSRPKTRDAESRPQYGGTKSTPFSGRGKVSSVDRRHAPPRERRPNHQQGLDVEDMIVPKRVDERRIRRSKVPSGFGRRGSLASSRKPDREAGDYRDKRKALQDLSHGSSWDKGSSLKHLDALQENLWASQRYESRSLPASGRSRRREDAFREQLQTPVRHEPKVSPSMAPSKGRMDTPKGQFQAPRGLEPQRPSSSAHSSRKPLTRAERRFALYGRGDTAPGGIPRSEVEVEENGDILRPASKQLRMAAKRRQLGGFIEPGLADEHDYQSDTPSRYMKSGERDSSTRVHADPGRVKDIPLSIPYTTSASEFLYGTSVIFAALTAMRRKMYKLYVYSGENREVGVMQNSIQDLARDRKIEVIKVGEDGLRMMDKLSSGRAHNVCQLTRLLYHFPCTSFQG